MAFGFIKKVFSFGKKEVIEEKIDETAPLPPLNFEALKDLKAETQPPVETKPVEGSDVLPPLPPEEPAPAPAEPEPTPEEPAPAPTPAIPAPAPVEIPAPAPGPVPAPREIPTEPEPEVQPAETPEPEAPPAPEPAPQEVPAPEAPEPAPVEIPVPPAVPEPEPAPEEVPAPSQPPEPAPVEVPEPAEPSEPELPPAEVPPPVRQPPLETRPVLREIAPEPEAIEISEVAPLPDLPSGKKEADRLPASPPSALPEAPPSTSADAPLAPLLRGEGHFPADAAEISIAASVTPAPQTKPAEGKVTVSKAVEKKAELQKAPEPAPKTTWFQRLRQGLSRSSKELSSNIAGVFTKRKLDEDTLQDLEDVLIRADLGMETAIRITDSLASGRYGKDVSESEVRAIMAQEVEKVLGPVALPLELDLSHKPHVILVVGVNGTGKTTTIGKLAAKLVSGGLSVTLAAGDTFRAAAIEQLKIWGERTGSPVVASKLGADAAGLAYDAFEKAKEAGSDVLIIDTAGRLQNRTELMAELEKIVRVLGKLDPEAPHTVLQTVDATTGQNALNQVEIFRNVAGVNGLVMTKLDGTARGGILVAIAAKHKLPVYFIGVGEQVDDLEPFSASDFAKAIAGVA
ncbi:fused signal recognition particle receptor [Mesorhizobium albiziae]|uniref:Signal recognition particle receptor FtsY n=1 Tax=Neomesorhizobium albiziae TaxID=335020 RepID=A0A1I3Y4N7_9HYPH|nr:signal recognition particle-docking protein FtsY [Mesorhizobium albiziae]GLS30114.1 hypothetical protein GCM10007937_18220 [Mesorhizobium albiziae]SFK26369.1 fused signal recognition particle receptor [Mesorhizobium albiziae]